MTFELEISTMSKNKLEILEMLERMNIHCNCIVINQCGHDSYFEITNGQQKIRIFNSSEHGLSKSRNLAIANSKADILGIADDDLKYYDNFEEKILDFYESNPKVDIGIFNIDTYEKEFPSKGFKCKLKNLGSFISMQCTFRVNAIKKKYIKFNEYFGSGSGYFSSGEENIFLSEAYKKHLNIFYSEQKILRREESLSSWFKGYNDPKFITDRGAIYTAISPFLSSLLMLRFVIRKRELIKPVSFFDAVEFMRLGRKQYMRLIKENEKHQ